MPAKVFDAFTRLDASDVNAYLANKSISNAIINGGFDINQRTFTSTTSNVYHFDRWRSLINTGTTTNSAQTFTLGDAPVAGARNFLRTVTTSQSGSGAYAINIQPIEDVRTFAGETVTISFYARAGSGTPKLGLELFQFFGTGGSPSASVSVPAGSITLSTSWARYSLSVAVPSITGKTVGTNNNSALELNVWYSAGSDFNARTSSIGTQNNTFDIWGVQLEAGTVANDFRRNANSLQGELAACQRYYQRFTSNNANGTFALGSSPATTTANPLLRHSVTMRTTPSSIEFSAMNLTDTVSDYAVSNITISTTLSSPDSSWLSATSSGLTQFRTFYLKQASNTAGFIAVNAEL
jgi:hypothetical protein